MNARDIVNEWLQIAYDDYDSALYLFENKLPKPLEIICYHCQQSVEKSLKAFLCANGADVPKTHETGLLCHYCFDFDEYFRDFFGHCEDLEIYATGTRYPHQIEVTDLDAKEALQQAAAIYDFVSERIRQFFEGSVSRE